VFSLIAILVLGNILITRVRDGLLESKQQATLDEAANGARTAQEAFDSADRSQPDVYDTSGAGPGAPAVPRRWHRRAA
jgi:type II secretory pathway pseudopilin PulG